MNIIFFVLSGAMVVFGILYAFVARGKHAFQREQDELVASGSDAAESQAPVPYIMLA